MKSLNVSRKDLEAAPERNWQEESTYSSIYLLPTKKKHDSGWHLICIVGVKDGVLEKAAYCDDVCWNCEGDFRDMALRMDMTYPAGVTHVWSNSFSFKVGSSLSSTNVTLVPR